MYLLTKTEQNFPFTVAISHSKKILQDIAKKYPETSIDEIDSYIIYNREEPDSEKMISTDKMTFYIKKVEILTDKELYPAVLNRENILIKFDFSYQELFFNKEDNDMFLHIYINSVKTGFVNSSIF